MAHLEFGKKRRSVMRKWRSCGRRSNCSMDSNDISKGTEAGDALIGTSRRHEAARREVNVTWHPIDFDKFKALTMDKAR